MKQSLLFQPGKRSRDDSTTTAGHGASEKPLIPLAARLRPDHVSDFVGQAHVLPTLTHMLNTQVPLVSIIVFGKREKKRTVFLSQSFGSGPAGCGKTSIMKLIARARANEYLFKSCSAVTTGAPELRKMMDEAERAKVVLKKQTALFCDEIHRLTKPQQDVLLQSVEEGAIILLGATTENPSFVLSTALLSRCRVFQFEALDHASVATLLRRAQEKDENLQIVSSEVIESIAACADGLF